MTTSTPPWHRFRAWGKGLIGLILRVLLSQPWLSNTILPADRRHLRLLMLVFVTHHVLIENHEPICDE